jgi:hypothetical protein
MIGMHKNTHSPMKLPSGRAVYDMLMAKIEPELVSSRLPELNALPPEEKRLRMKKYANAFQAYDKAFLAWITHLHETVTNMTKSLRQESERLSGQQDADALRALEASM